MQWSEWISHFPHLGEIEAVFEIILIFLSTARRGRLQKNVGGKTSNTLSLSKHPVKYFTTADK